MNLTTHTPCLAYRIILISPINGSFLLSVWWIRSRMLPTSSPTSERDGIGIFWSCKAATSISNNSSRGSREWNWVSRSGGHKSLKRDARWVYKSALEHRTKLLTSDSGRWGFLVNWLMLGSSESWLYSKSDNSGLPIAAGWLEDKKAWRPLRWRYCGTGRLWKSMSGWENGTCLHTQSSTKKRRTFRTARSWEWHHHRDRPAVSP